MGGYEATEEQVAAAKELGVDPKNRKMMMLVEDMLRADSLPPRWTSTYEPMHQRWVYRHRGTGETRLEHPVLDYYRGAVFMDNGGYRTLMKNMGIHKPTNAEIKAMCDYFEIAEAEDVYVQEVGELACVAPLPPGWEEFTDISGQIKFRMAAAGWVLEEHPLDSYFRELRDRRRKELARRRWAAIKAMQAMVNVHQRSVMPVDDVPPPVEANEVPSPTRAQDPRMGGLMSEWRELQMASGKLAAVVYAVQSASLAEPLEVATKKRRAALNPLLSAIGGKAGEAADAVPFARAGTPSGGAAAGNRVNMLGYAGGPHASGSGLSSSGNGLSGTGGTASGKGGAAAGGRASLAKPRPPAGGVSGGGASGRASLLGGGAASGSGRGSGAGDAAAGGSGRAGAAGASAGGKRDAHAAAGGTRGADPRATRMGPTATATAAGAGAPAGASSGSSACGEEEGFAGHLSPRSSDSSLEELPVDGEGHGVRPLSQSTTAAQTFIPTLATQTSGGSTQAAVAARKSRVGPRPSFITGPGMSVAAAAAAATAAVLAAGTDASARSSSNESRSAGGGGGVSGSGGVGGAVTEQQHSSPLQQMQNLQMQQEAAALQKSAAGLFGSGSGSGGGGGAAGLGFDPSMGAFGALGASSQAANDATAARAAALNGGGSGTNMPTTIGLQSQMLSIDGAGVGFHAGTTEKLLNPSQLLDLANFTAHGGLGEAQPADGAASATFEPNDDDSEDGAYARALRSIQAVRLTVDNATHVMGLMPADTPAILATLPKDWMTLVRSLPADWADILRVLPADWREKLDSLPPGWLATLKQLPPNWAEVLHYHEWPQLVPILAKHPNWAHTLSTLPPDWEDILATLAPDWRERANKLPPNWSELLAALPKNFPDSLPNLPEGWAAKMRMESWPTLLQELPEDWVEAMAWLPKNWREMKDGLPPNWAEMLAALPLNFTASLSSLPAGWAGKMKMEQWPHMLRQLPDDWLERQAWLPNDWRDMKEHLPHNWKELLSGLPPNWSQIVKQLPPDWATTMRVSEWPHAIASLPPDWLDTLRSLPPDWKNILEKLPHNWEAMLARLPADWASVLAQMPADWAEKMRVGDWPSLIGSLPENWPELLRSLPPGWADLVKTLPPNWHEMLSALPPNFLSILRKLPPNWAEKMAVEEWPSLVRSLPDGWPAVVSTLPSTWSETMAQVPHNYLQLLRYSEWPTLLHRLPPDWVEIVDSLPPNWMSLVKGLPANWLHDFLAWMHRDTVNKAVQTDEGGDAMAFVVRSSLNVMAPPPRSPVGSRGRLRSNNPGSDWDPRPVAPEIKRRANTLKDRDVRFIERNGLYDELPDATAMHNYADSEVAHLKQRLVRSEMSRAQVSAKLVSDQRMHMVNTQLLQNENEKLLSEVQRLRKELELLHDTLQSAQSALPSSAAAALHSAGLGGGMAIGSILGGRLGSSLGISGLGSINGGTSNGAGGHMGPHERHHHGGSVSQGSGLGWNPNPSSNGHLKGGGRLGSSSSTSHFYNLLAAEGSSFSMNLASMSSGWIGGPPGGSLSPGGYNGRAGSIAANGGLGPQKSGSVLNSNRRRAGSVERLPLPAMQL